MTTVENNEIVQNIVNLRDCIAELAKVWTNDVKKTTVFNCFSKAGFNSVTHEEDSEDNMTLSELKKQWDFLKSSGNVADDVPLEDFICVDEDVAVSNFPDDEDILQNVQMTNSNELLKDDDDDCDDDCDEPEEKNPTDHEVLQAFKIIRRGFQLKDGVPDNIFDCLNKCETFIERDVLFKRKVQQKITHFFK